MCECVNRALKKEFEKGVNQEISQGKLSLLTNQLKHRFGSLSNQTLSNLKISSLEKLDELSLNIFNLTDEENLNKLLLN